jgi:hypothetical protein
MVYEDGPYSLYYYSVQTNLKIIFIIYSAVHEHNYILTRNKQNLMLLFQLVTLFLHIVNQKTLSILRPNENLAQFFHT